MPSWKDNPNVMPYVENLWSYLNARADGTLAPGRPEKTRFRSIGVSRRRFSLPKREDGKKDKFMLES